MTSKAELLRIQSQLQELFDYTSGFVLREGVGYVPDARIAAAQAAAEVAYAIVEIEEVLRESEPAGELRKFRVEVFVGNTRKFEETVWAESRELVESHVNRKYARAGTVDITSIEEVE